MLTDEQQAVVDAGGLVCLSACPGSGKTTVVAHRFLRLVRSGALLPFQGIGALSFTNIAKDSVVQQLRELGFSAVRHPHFIGTIDSFLNSQVFRPFGHFVCQQSGRSVTILRPNSSWLRKVYPKVQQWGIDPNQVTYDRNGQIVCHVRTHMTAEMSAYVNYIKQDSLQKGFITQQDVNYFCLKLLREFPVLRQVICKRYPHFIIDEAQDCSEVQMAVVDELVAGGHQSIMLVGDPCQAIYEWRDAVPQLFIAKGQAGEWTQLSLTISQRSGDAVCTFLNRFHSDRVIHPNPVITGSVVEVVSGKPAAELIQDFVASARAAGLLIDRDHIAVLYGGHSSQVSKRNLKTKPEEFWADTVNRERGMSAVLTLPIVAKLHFANKEYATAFQAVLEFAYYQMHRSHLKSDADLEDHVLASQQARAIVWKFCKQLPDLTLSIDEWIQVVNDQIRLLNQELSIEREPLLLQKKRGLRAMPCLRMELYKNPDVVERPYPYTLDNVHQVKSRTFEAVLLFIDSGRGRWKFSESKLRRALSGAALFNGDDADDCRCLYVAASRARRLLWIACEVDSIRTAYFPEHSVDVPH